MRYKLGNIGSKERHSYTGEFERYGTKRGWKGSVDETILLLNIKDLDGNLICDHLWFNKTKQFEVLNLQKGNVVQFDARVALYEKGYKGWRDDLFYDDRTTEDYKLSFPTKVKLIA